MDELELFLTSQHAFGERVHAVTDEQWRLGTPCAEWDVSTLVEHLVEEHRWAAPLVHGQDLEAAGMIVQGARDEGSPGGNWATASVGSADAFSEEGALDRTVHLSRGDTPARDYIREMIFDLVVHGWDLQRAIGYDGEFSPEVLDAVLGWVDGFGDLAASGMFAAPVDVGDDAPAIDRLVARTGRDPNG